jgi:hypothetical protein
MKFPKPIESKDDYYWSFIAREPFKVYLDYYKKFEVDAWREALRKRLAEQYTLWMRGSREAKPVAPLLKELLEEWL